MSKTILEFDEHDGFWTPTPFNEFEVLRGAKQMDIKDKVVS
jgi:hypothetical protein